MSTLTRKVATLDDLARVDGKAELISGRIVPLMPTGRRPSRVASKIFRSLDDHAEANGMAEAFNDNAGFVVGPLTSGRQSFSPDAAYILGPFPDDPMRFLQKAPIFAVEVRSESDHGPAAEREMAAKRADYFEAGTLVVWDVDPIADLIRSYRSDTPEDPTVFARGLDVEADAEPAVSGWRISLDSIFG